MHLYGGRENLPLLCVQEESVPHLPAMRRGLRAPAHKEHAGSTIMRLIAAMFFRPIGQKEKNGRI